MRSICSSSVSPPATVITNCKVNVSTVVFMLVAMATLSLFGRTTVTVTG